MFAYIIESYVFENKCYTPNVLAERNIIYIFFVPFAFHWKNCQKNTGTKTSITEIVALKQNN